METLRKLGKSISTKLSEEEVYTQAMLMMKQNSFDIPFACVYRFDKEDGKPTIVATTGIDIDHPEILREERTSEGSALAQAARHSAITVRNISRPSGSL